MRGLKAGKTMTTREVAESLGTSKKVVLENAKKCLPTKVIEHGKPTLWTEEELTLVLEQMKSSNPNQYTVTAPVTVAETSLTPVFKVQQGLKQAQENATTIEQQMQIANAGMQALAKAMAMLKAENSNLKVTLDESKEWASVKRMESLNPNRKFDWRILKAKSTEMGIEIRKVFDQNYGEVNSYHKSVWESCYELDEMPWD